MNDSVMVDLVLPVMASVALAIWTWVKAEFLADLWRNRRTATALHALEAGVEKTYHVYVKAIKEANADGKLTAEEREKARGIAIGFAREFGRDQGVDLVKDIGVAGLELIIAKIVKALKR